MKLIKKVIDNNIRKDFLFLKKHPEQVFFDSAATSLKPKVVIDAINDYYLNYATNTHTLDCKLAESTKNKYEQCRKIIADFLNCQQKEIIFSPSATMALNQIFYGLGQYLKAGDEIITTWYEHSSLLLPIFNLKKNGIKVKFLPANESGVIDSNELKKLLSNKTRIIAFSNMNNSLGTINNVDEIVKIIKEHKLVVDRAIWPFQEILSVIDGAQSVAHFKTNLSQWNVDFFAFSAHKLFGPTGIGAWYGKYNWLFLIPPLVLGGGMNGRIYQNGEFTFLSPPEVFEAGTPNLAGVFGFAAAIKYVNKIGFSFIENHEKQLKTYLIKLLKANFNDLISIYNDKYQEQQGMVLFNIKNVFAEEVATFLGNNNICVRSGNFCAKLISEIINQPAAIRVSFSIYNSFADIDKLINVLKIGFDNGGDFLNDFFV